MADGTAMEEIEIDGSILEGVRKHRYENTYENVS